MIRRSPWAGFLLKLLLLAFIAALIGLISGHLGFCLSMALLAVFVWHLRNLYRLEVWLRHEQRFQPPQSQGLWGEVFGEVYRLQKRNRKRRKRLSDYLKRYKESTMAMPDGIVVLDAVGAIEWWNNKAAEFLGLQWPRDNGQRLLNLIRYPHLSQYMQAGDYSEPLEIRALNQARQILEVRITPYGQNQRLFMLRDVSELHRLQTMRKDFVANASHELRTPLTVLRGYLEMMAEDEQAIAAQWRPSLHSMLGQTLRMSQLIEELLTLSNLEETQGSGKEAAIDVPRLLTALTLEAQALSGDDQHLIEQVVEPELWLWGNESEIRSAFGNLLTNAVRYTPPKGRICLYWHNSPKGPRFTVKDSGIGISAEHLPRLTERFYRVDEGRTRQKGGTGLGLAIVKHVLLRHQAQLQIESSKGSGSEFCCQFPRERARPQLQLQPASKA